MVATANSLASNASAEDTRVHSEQAGVAPPDRSAHEAADRSSRGIELATADRSADQAAGELTLTSADIRAIARAVADELQGRRTSSGAHASSPHTLVPVPAQEPPRIDPVDLDDETWMRQCIDAKKRWALRGRELDNVMRGAASPAARAEALAALERHETEYKVMCRRENEVGMRRAQLKNERDIAAEGWDNWLRRKTKERDEIRAEGWDNWYRRRLAEQPARADDQSGPSNSRRPRRGAAKKH